MPETEDIEKSGEPYSSPLTYEIRGAELIWQAVKKGVKDFRVGIGVNPFIYYPSITSDREGHFVFWTILRSSEKDAPCYSEASRDDKFLSELQNKLQKHLGKSLRVVGSGIYRQKSNDPNDLEQLVNLNAEQYDNQLIWRFTPDSTSNNKEQFINDLDLGLKILQIYITELFLAQNFRLDPAKLIIAPEIENPLEADTKKEILRQTIIIEERPSTTFEEIGGQDRAVREARDLARQIANPGVFEKWGAEVPRGILFYGDPGNGKTLIARALAHESQSTFLSVNASDVASKWYGDSEKLTHYIFEIAREEAQKYGGHTIIFIDEVDALIPARGEMMHEATRKVIGELLVQIDGLKDSGDITVIASTNRPEDVDRAFLSRMTQQIEVPNPTSDGIAEIFKIHFDKATKKAGRQLISNDTDFIKIAQMFVGISGRDIADIVQIVLRGKALEELDNISTGLVSFKDIEAALEGSSKIRKAVIKAREKTSLGFHTP